MSQESNTVVIGGEFDTGKRPLLGSALRGLACKCPNCGKGQIFDGFLKVKPACEKCGEDLSHHRADDLPAYLNIFFVGHVVLGTMMVFMTWKLLSMWATMFVTIFICVAAAFLFMRPLKGMVVGIQWALRMHGFGGHHD